MLESMEPQKEQIAPEIMQAITAKAAASGLSINDYLAQLLGLTNGHEEESSLAGLHEEPRPNPATLAALQRIAARQEKRPFTKSSDTVRMLREARSGMMWGYEPTE
jgi:hypothetical protein